MEEDTQQDRRAFVPAATELTQYPACVPTLGLFSRDNIFFFKPLLFLPLLYQLTKEKMQCLNAMPGKAVY